MVRKDGHLGEYCTDKENKPTHVCSGCYKKCHRLGGSNNRHLFLKVLEAGESKVKTKAFFFLGLYIAVILLGAQMTSSLCMSRDKEEER